MLCKEILLFCLYWDGWCFLVVLSSQLSFISVLRALNFLMSDIVTLAPIHWTKFRSMCLRSCHFYCRFSVQAIVFPVSGHFLLSRTSFALLCNILRGAMILVNGGLVILPHVPDDLGSVQSGHEGRQYMVRGKTGKLGTTEECNTSSHSVNKVFLGRRWPDLFCIKK